MSCGFKDENGDICGETFTCKPCRAEIVNIDQMARMESRVKDLEDTVALLLHHCHRTLTDPEAIMELEDMTRGTASYMKSSLGVRHESGD